MLATSPTEPTKQACTSFLPVKSNLMLILILSLACMLYLILHLCLKSVLQNSVILGRKPKLWTVLSQPLGATGQFQAWECAWQRSVYFKTNQRPLVLRLTYLSGVALRWRIKVGHRLKVKKRRKNIVIQQRIDTYFTRCYLHYNWSCLW